MKRDKILKRVLNICQSRAIILPKDWATELPDFVWVIKEENGKITIQPALEVS